PFIVDNRPESLCANTLSQNFSAVNPQPSGVEYTWTADNADVWKVGNSRQHSIVNFKGSGTSLVILTANIVGTSCASSDTAIVQVSNSVAGVHKVVYYSGQFICLNNEMDSYRWGYDDAKALDSVVLDGETGQDYFNP